jgi:mannose-6-phosphate isomerase-like protein (cupin superfamily)
VEGVVAMDSGKVVRLEDVVPITYGGGEETRFLLRGSDTSGRSSFYEVRMPAQEGSVWHVHHDTDESFYVLEGEFEIKVGDEIHKAPAGTMVHGPRGVWHSFFNVGSTTGLMLCTMTPGGIELFFEELSEVLTRPERPDWDTIKAVGERHGITAAKPRGGPHGGPPVGSGAAG